MSDSKTQLFKICALSLAHYMAVAVIRNFIPLHTEALGAAPHITGAVVASFAFLPLFLSLPGGTVVDRIGSGKVVTVGGLLMVASSTSLVLFPSVVYVAASQLMIGLAHVLVAISTQSYVSRIGDDLDRTSNFGVYSFSTALGFMIGPLVGGALADMWGFGATFAGAGLLSVGTVALAQALPRPADRGEDGGGSKSGDFIPLKSLLREGKQLLDSTPVRLSIFISMCALFAFAIRTSFYPVYLESIGYSPGRIGFLISIQSGVALALRPLLGRFLRRVRFTSLLIAALLVGAAAVGITPYLGSFVALVVAAVVAGITTALSQPISMILMAEGSGKKQRGLAMSLRLTGNRVVMLLGPAVLGLVASWLGVTYCFLLSAGTLVAGAGVLAVWSMAGAKDIRLQSRQSA